MQLLDAYPWISWPEAKLETAMLYLRRSRLVTLPLNVKGLVPTDVVELDRLKVPV